VRRHRKREIHEGDFSFASGEVCAPAQTSGVKNLVSTRFFTLSDHAARKSGNTRRKPGTGFSDAITGAWACGTGTGVKNLVSTRFFTLSDHAARKSGNARRKPGTGFSDAITGAWACGTGTGVKNLVSTRFFTLLSILPAIAACSERYRYGGSAAF